MRLGDVVSTSVRIGSTRARTEKVALLADLLRRLPPDEVAIGVAYLSGHVRQGRIGLGWAALRAASSEAGSGSAAPAAPATAEPSEPTLFDRAEDLAGQSSSSERARGSAEHFVGQSASSEQASIRDEHFAAQSALSLRDVDDVFKRLASTSGAGSAAARAAILRDLFVRATRPEGDFLIRLVMGELRQGALTGIMEEAVARASDVPLAALRRAAMLSGDLEAVAVAALSGGVAALQDFRLQLFQPVQPMLAQPVDDLQDALQRLGTAGLEFKFDGARIQIHRADRDVRVFSRQLNDVTAAVPEVVEAVQALPLRDAVLDGEVIALDDEGRPHPFQVTMRRFGRTLEVDRARGELPLSTFLFDVLRLDGVDTLDAPARERWAALRERAPALAVPQRITADPAEAEAFYDEALARGHEGIMAKALDAPYEAGGRGYAWLKVKAVHTLDLVVLAAEWGSGRREGWLSNIHLGARDAETGDFVMLGKTFKGMTDALLEWQTREFQRLEVRREGHVVFLRPELVVEVAFNDVQESPRYPGGMALRLARVKAYRPDKRPDEADTVQAVREILRGDQRKQRRGRAPR